MIVKPIDTIYQGYKFRSRLEARWAVFIDALGIQWEYEPEGYDLGGLYYLPDFWLPRQEIFVEIKPALNDDDWPGSDVLHKASLLEDATAHGCIIICGTPGPVSIYTPTNSYEGFVCGDYSYYWCECPVCGAVGIQFDGRSARNKHTKDCDAKTGDKGYNMASPRLLDAYAKARQARFEHKAGHSPADIDKR